MSVFVQRLGFIYKVKSGDKKEINAKFKEKCLAV
jgi:hypothetical protein